MDLLDNHTLNIAVFGDTHGHLRLMFQLCRLWQLENGVHLDAILQCGDMGFFPDPGAADKATRRFAQLDSEEYGFAYYFRQKEPGDTNDSLMDRLLEGDPGSLDTVRCPVIWCQGNHEDFQQLIRGVVAQPLSPVDRYQRLYFLQPGKVATLKGLSGLGGVPGFERRIALYDEKATNCYLFPSGVDLLDKEGDEVQKYAQLEVGSLGGSQEALLVKPMSEKDAMRLKYVSQQGALQLAQKNFNVLISHCAPAGVGMEFGSDWLRDTIEQAQPVYHFYAHHRGPIAPERIGETQCYWLNDVNFKRSNNGALYRLESGCMGMLSWKNLNEHHFRIVDEPWLDKVFAKTWQYL
jgi:hypothetical protein